MGIKNTQAKAGDCQVGRNIVLEAKVHSGLYCSSRRKKRIIISMWNKMGMGFLILIHYALKARLTLRPSERPKN
jgi:hypothetical protein